MKDVELLIPHKHAGQQKKAGDVISVSDTDAQWLINRNIAKLCEKETALKQDKKS